MTEHHIQNMRDQLQKAIDENQTSGTRFNLTKEQIKDIIEALDEVTEMKMKPYEVPEWK